MIEKLTPEQEALMVVTRDKWINRYLGGNDEIDENAARAGIEWMYQITDLEKPLVIFVDSPLAVQYAANILSIEGSASQVHSQVASQVDSQVYSQVRSQVYSQVASQVDSQVYSQVRSQVYSQVHSQVYDQVDSQVYSQVRSQVYDQVDSQVDSQVYSQVRSQVYSQVHSQVYDQVDSQVYSQVRSQVYDQVHSQVDSQVASEKLKMFTSAYNVGGWYAGWGSYIDFYAQIGVAKHKDLKVYLDYLMSGAFYGVFLEGVAIVCRPPEAVRRDQSKNLDSDQLPAIEWRDGYKLWYLHGVNFEEDVWQKIISQELTLPELAKLELGADQRAVAIQMLRPDRLLEQMNAKLIATGQKYAKLLEQFGEDYCAANFPWSLNTPTELYEVKNFMDTGDTEYCMKMEHPSIKGKFYIEWIEPSVGKKKDADLAQAHAFGMTIEEYFAASEA